jgi:serine/alanine adding enzyme
LPLILVPGLLFGRSFVSLPFLDEGGICADDEQTEAELYQKALRLLEDHRTQGLDLRHRYPTGLQIPVHGSKVTLVLELKSDPDEMWDGFDAKLRNQIRKATKSGLTVSWHHAEGLTDFYDVFSANMRDLGSPVHSRDFFAAILKEFCDRAKLILVRKGDYVIGGGLCFSFGDTLLMPWAASRREYFSLCPNNLLYWEAIRLGCEKGYKRFDFGRSSFGTGPYRFKRQWGGIDEPLHWQYIARNGQPKTLLQADDPRLQWAVQTWQRLPVGLANLLGPALRKRMSN